MTDGSSPADLVQDMYIRELKNYKPPPVKPSDSEGHVQKFSPPKVPQSPEEGDIANELKAYENQQVEIEGQATGGEAAATEVDWFEEEVRAYVHHDDVSLLPKDARNEPLGTMSLPLSSRLGT